MRQIPNETVSADRFVRIQFSHSSHRVVSSIPNRIWGDDEKRKQTIGNLWLWWQQCHSTVYPHIRTHTHTRSRVRIRSLVKRNNIFIDSSADHRSAYTLQLTAYIDSITLNSHVHSDHFVWTHGTTHLTDIHTQTYTHTTNSAICTPTDSGHVFYAKNESYEWYGAHAHLNQDTNEHTNDIVWNVHFVCVSSFSISCVSVSSSELHLRPSVWARGTGTHFEIIVCK